MANYTQILNQVQSLSRLEQLKLLEELRHLLKQTVEIQDDGELISLAEILQSQDAWDNYLAGNNQGVTSQDLNRILQKKVEGTSGQQLLQFAGAIPADDLQQMQEAIAQDCERIDIHEW